LLYFLFLSRFPVLAADPDEFDEERMRPERTGNIFRMEMDADEERMLVISTLRDLAVRRIWGYRPISAAFQSCGSRYES
jgi:hypothetical protein